MSRGLTLERVAKEIRRLGAAESDPVYCSKQTVSTWRSGSVTPGPTYRRLLAKWLGMPVQMVVVLVEKQNEMLAEFKPDGSLPNPINHCPMRLFTSTSAVPASILSVGRDQLADGRYVQDGDEEVDRRNFLRTGVMAGAGFPSGYFTPTVRLPNDRPQELTIAMLETYWALLEECWRLCNLGQFAPIDGIVQSILPDLVGFASDHPPAAALTAQYLRLLSVVRIHELKLIEKVALNQKAVEYARAGNCSTTLVATLWELAVAFKYADQPRNALAAYREALPFAEKAAPLARSRIYAGAAAALAQGGEFQDASKYIRKAQDVFPGRPEVEAHWQSVDYGVWLLAFYEGSIHLSRNDSLAAERAFLSYEKHPMAALTPQRCRLEILNQRARAARMGGELERYADCLGTAMTGAMAIRSKKRLDEAFSIYHNETPSAWRSHPLLKSIPEVAQSSIDSTNQ